MSSHIKQQVFSCLPLGPNFYNLVRQTADCVPVLFSEETKIQLVAYSIKLCLIASTIPM